MSTGYEPIPFIEPPNPLGSSNEKIERIERLTVEHNMLMGFLTREGIDPELADQISRAFDGYNTYQTQKVKNLITQFQSWMNRHNHNGTVGPDGSWYPPGSTDPFGSGGGWQAGSGDVFSGSSDKDIRTIDSDGNSVLTTTVAANVGELGADLEGNVFWQASASPYQVAKLDSDMVEDWSIPLSNAGSTVIIDRDGNCHYSDGSTAYKVDPDGTEIWNFVAASALRGLAVDSDGNVYIGEATGSIIKKLDSDGNQITAGWPVDVPSHNPYAIACEPTSFVYIGGDIFYKYTSAGSSAWSYDTGISPIACVIGPDESSYVEGLDAATSTDRVITKLDADGALVWEWLVPSGTDPSALALDPSGTLYAAGGTADIVWAIDSEGSTLWSMTDHTSNVNAVIHSAGSYGALAPAAE